MTLGLRFDGCALQCAALADFDWNTHLPRSASVQLRTPIFAVIRSLIYQGNRKGISGRSISKFLRLT
jgi:hypothetical protein